MFDTPSPSPTLIRRIVVVLLALAAAVQIVSSQIGMVAIIGQQPQLGLRLPNAHARPMALVAWQLASAAGPKRQTLALAALANRQTPLVAPAFAAIARVQNDAEGAWLDHAWALSRRDAWVDSTMFAHAHARHDTANELAALAALLDLQFAPGAMREAYLNDLAQPPAFAQAVAALERVPHWRSAFFGGLHVEAMHQATLVSLITALRDKDAPLSRAEMAGLLAPMIYGHDANLPVADAVWRAWLGQVDPWAWPASGAEAVRLPFEWVMTDRAHIDLTNTAPVLAFTGNEDPATPIATKTMVVAAGRYQFTARPAGALAPSAISAIVLCDGQTVSLANGAVWQTDHACRTSDLRLIVHAAQGTVISAALRPLPRS